MFQAKRQAAFSTWRAPGHEIEVVYSQAVMHDIVLRSLDGLHSMPGVGLEVGGVLFGTADESEVRITASRELSCAHAKGHVFQLNEADESRLERLLSYYKEEPELAGLAPVGFYVSRTKQNLSLTEDDVRLFAKYFPEPQQVVLVVKVARGLPTRAGFFVREPDGGLQTLMTHREFEAAPASEAGLRPMSRAEREAAIPQRTAEVVPIRPPEETEGDELDEPAATHEPGWTVPEDLVDRPKRHPWPWKTLAAAMAAIAVLGSLIVYMRTARRTSGPRQSVGLRVVERNGFLLAEWNGNAKLLEGKTGGALEVDDGEPRRYVMNETLLRGGQWRVLTTSENVMVKLRLGASGEHVESVRYFDPGASARVVRPAADAVSLETQTRLEEKQRRLQEMIEANNALDIRRESLLAVVRQQLDQASKGGAETGARPVVQLPPNQAAASPEQPLPPPPAANTASSTPLDAPPGLAGQAVRPPSAPPAGQVESAAPRFPDRATTPRPAAQPQAASTPPAYQGPRSGRVIWTGSLAPGGTLLITGRQASLGALTGSMPAAPLRIGAYAAELGGQGFTAYSSSARHSRGNVVEQPGPQNGWQRTAYRYDPRRASDLVVAEAPSADNGWQRVLFRAGSRPVTAILIDWEIAQ
ncbi:MAG: hypothetical protein IPJ98_11120 [Bryobacterales bacterium]|nr:hypothetical protein [Bryobacterales bacterium]